MIRIGCPRILDFSQRHKPFFAIKRRIAELLLHEERLAEFLKLSAQQRIALQQFPPIPTSTEYVEKAARDAWEAVQRFGKAYIPWYHWMSAEELRKIEEEQLRTEAQVLIEQWKSIFGDR